MWHGELRLATPNDLTFLQKMLYEAAFWRPGVSRPPVDEALKRPGLARILDGSGRPGDTAIVAVDKRADRIGAAWYRYWTKDEHSYGFVDPATPELGIGVCPKWRGQGIGRRLIEELMIQAQRSGVMRMSLSVEPDNHALFLYKRLGFKKVGTVGGAWTMVADVSAHKTRISRD